MRTGDSCAAQTRHNDFDQRAGRGPALFDIMKGHDNARLSATDRSHKGFDRMYRTDTIIVKATSMKSINVANNYVSIAHGFLHHVRANRSVVPSSRYVITASETVIRRRSQLRFGIA